MIPAWTVTSSAVVGSSAMSRLGFPASAIAIATRWRMLATLAPHSRFADEVTHAGIDVMYVSEGTLVLVVDGVDYPLDATECAVWPSSHAHTVRNDGDVPAVALGFTTEAVHR